MLESPPPFLLQVSPATGLPTGCPAFDSAYHWNDHTTSKGYAGPMDCPLQQYAPEGEPLHKVVEEYAEDQDAWLRDFLPALVLILLLPPLLEYLEGLFLLYH